MKTVSQQEGVEPLFGAAEIVAGIRPGAADITNRFIQSRGDAYLGNVAIAEELGNVLGIAFIGLDLFVRFALGFGGGHDHTIDFELAQPPCEDESGGSGFITDMQIPELDFEFGSEFTQGSFGGEIATAAFSVVNWILPRSRESVGNGDCFVDS